MAQVIRLIDDIDNSDWADETVTFGLDGQTWEIDLTHPRAEDLRAVFAPFISAARRVGGRRQISVVGHTDRPSPSPARAANGVTKVTKLPPAASVVKAWAAGEGHEVKAGRVPGWMMDAYMDAHPDEA